MEKELKELSDKLDKILANQEKILNQLNQSAILPTQPIPPNNNALTKKEKSKLMEELKLVINHGPKIKAQFNLAAVPKKHRILEYLKTKDENIFKGLKRKE